VRTADVTYSLHGVKQTEQAFLAGFGDAVGRTIQWQPTEPGQLHYYCPTHPNMTGGVLEAVMNPTETLQHAMTQLDERVMQKAAEARTVLHQILREIQEHATSVLEHSIDREAQLLLHRALAHIANQSATATKDLAAAGAQAAAGFHTERFTYKKSIEDESNLSHQVHNLMHKKLAAEYGAASLVQVSAQAERLLRADQDALVAQGQMLKSAPGSSAKQAKEEQLLQAAEKIDVAQHALTDQAGEAVKHAQEASSALTDIMKQQRLHRAQLKLNTTLGWQQQLHHLVDSSHARLNERALASVRAASADTRLTLQAATEQLSKQAAEEMAAISQEQTGRLNHSITALQQHGHADLEATVAAASGAYVGPSAVLQELGQSAESSARGRANADFAPAAADLAPPPAEGAPAAPAEAAADLAPATGGESSAVQVVLALAKRHLDLAIDPVHEENELRRVLADVGTELVNRQVILLGHALKAALSGMKDKVSAAITMAVEGNRAQLESAVASEVLQSKAAVDALQQEPEASPAEAAAAAAAAVESEVEGQVQQDLLSDPEEVQRKMEEQVLAMGKAFNANPI
jgi:hypothetical protein